MQELLDESRVANLNAGIETHLPDDGGPFQRGLAAPSFGRGGAQAKAAAVRPEPDRSRTA